MRFFWTNVFIDCIARTGPHYVFFLNCTERIFFLMECPPHPIKNIETNNFSNVVCNCINISTWNVALEMTKKKEKYFLVQIAFAEENKKLPFAWELLELYHLSPKINEPNLFNKRTHSHFGLVRQKKISIQFRWVILLNAITSTKYACIHAQHIP